VPDGVALEGEAGRTLYIRADELKGKRLVRRLRCLEPVGGYV
jgi:hypothetical protein